MNQLDVRLPLEDNRIDDAPARHHPEAGRSAAANLEPDQQVFQGNLGVFRTPRDR